MNEFYFIIDTNQYTGGFERQMCAYMTGHVGECGVGQKEADEYLEEYTPVKGVTEKADEHGCYRPVRICTTPNVWNNGLGFHYRDGEEAQALNAYKEYVREKNEKQIQMVESYRDKNIPSWSDDAIDNAITRYREEIRQTEEKTEVSRYKAYQSILIYFEKEPDGETIEFLKARATEYVATSKKNISITGFRLEQKS